MKCLILAAGYATRLYPLTANFPKPLLPIKQDATILDRLMEDLKRNVGIEEFIVVTNHKFVILFEAWKKEQEKEALRIQKAKEKEEEAKKKKANRVAGSVARSAAGTVGRELGNSLGKSIGGSFGKRLGGNVGASLGRGIMSTLFKL